MKVKAIKTINGYYSIQKDNIYDVVGVIYFATPFFPIGKPQEIDA